MSVGDSAAGDPIADDIEDDLALTDDALIDGRLRLLQPVRGHRAGHDALLLAASVPATARRAVDLGTGVGTAGLAFAVRVPQAFVHLVEIDPATASLARRNAGRQQPDISPRVVVVEADITSLARPAGPAEPAPRMADAVMMNPPFNDPAHHRVSPTERRALAHMGDEAVLDDWVRAAERLLAPGGHLALIHRPEALETILAALAGRFGAVTIRPVHSRPGLPAIRVLIGAVKGRRTLPAVLPGLLLADADGQQTPEAVAVLRQGEHLA